MLTRRIITCGGIKPADVSASAADVLRLDLWGNRGKANVSLCIDDIHANLMRDVPIAFHDFVEIATYIYCADQAVGRGGIDVDTFGAKWRREFEFHIPVRCPDFWNSKETLAALSETVDYLTDDFYSFSFYPAKNPPGFQRYLDFSNSDNSPGDVQQVMMFSGGLDSLAGAIQEAVVEKRRILLVNHRSTDKLNRKHAELLGKLKAQAGSFTPGHLRVRVHKDSDITKDYHQRSRSLLYAALGGTVAHLVRLNSIRFYENGVVASNLPVCAQVVGSRATRTAHPRVLAGFQKLLSLVAGSPFEITNPFLWTTRGEAIKRILDAGCGELIEPSMSCAHTWQISNEHTHCGLCSQCIDRRLGMIVAGAEKYDPITHYRADVFTEPLPKDMDKMMVATYLERANSVNSISTETQFMDRFPEVLDILPYVDGRSSSALARVLDLYKRHAREVNQAVDTMLSRYPSALRQRNLPTDCLLRLVYESASVTSVATEGATAIQKPASCNATVDGLHEIKEQTHLLKTVLQNVEDTPQRTAALLRGTIKQKLGTFGNVIEENFAASAHFTNINWRGEKFVIRRTAAVIIETLYIAQKSCALPGLHQEEVFAQVYTADKRKWPSTKVRIQNFFRTGDAKRLWDSGLLSHDGKGNFSLTLKLHTSTQ